MTEEQQVKIKALARCTFLPGSYAKRFVGDMSCISLGDTLTEKQSAYLDKLFWQYRKQHGLPAQKPD